MHLSHLLLIWKLQKALNYNKPKGEFITMTAEPGIVDSHIHLLPGRLALKIRAFFEERITAALAYPLDHTTVLNMLQQVGIDTVWSLPYAHKAGVAAGMNQSSAEIVKEQATHPVKMIGGATVHPLDNDPAAIVLEALDTYGLKVLKLHCSVGNFRADDPAFNPVWALVSERRMPVIIHLGHAVSGHTAASEVEPIARVAEAFPQARIIIAHCGHVAGPEALDLVETYPSVYADLTPVVFELVAVPAERVNQLAHKLLFGSDAPNTGLSVQQCLAHIKNFELEPEAEANILGGTARKLLAEVLLK